MWGNGWQFATRRDRDAKLFLEDGRFRRGRRLGRRERVAALIVAVAGLVGWAVWAIIGG